MSDVTMDQKLQLVQQVRARYHEDQFDLSNRERILYRRSDITPVRTQSGNPYGDPNGSPYGELMPPAEGPVSFFRIRFFIAALLLTVVILMDKNGIAVAGITADKIFQAISDDYEEKITQWAETLSPSK